MPEKKLTRCDKRDITRRWANGDSTKEIANDYPVTLRHIQRVVAGTGFTKKLAPEEAEIVRWQYWTTDDSQKDVAEDWGITQGQVSRIVNGKCWKQDK